MNTLFTDSVFFGVTISLVTYFAGNALKKKYRSALLNPLLLAIVFTIVILLVFRIDYNTYYAGAKYLSYLLTPATICLAIPLYEQFEILKKNVKAVLAGICAGVLMSLLSIFVMALIFGFTHEQYVTFLPKSITTAIGMGVSEELGGYVAITVAIIIITGVLGNVIGQSVCKLFRITEPVAKGIALGTASHAIGTARAMEMGEVEGALSSLSIVLAGVLTVAGVNLFAGLI
ncbi:MAG: LrgB family protein [Oscillospiraceae bacterium]|nr:LrgB family protein [Oscillospiraceae bacterium]